MPKKSKEAAQEKVSKKGDAKANKNKAEAGGKKKGGGKKK